MFCFLCAPCGEEEDGELKEKAKKGQKACSIILILGCVWVTFGGMIVSHLGVWGVIFPPVWSHSPDLCKLAVKHITTWLSCPTHGLLIHTNWATAPSIWAPRHMHMSIGMKTGRHAIESIECVMFFEYFFLFYGTHADILVTEWFICICVPSKEKKKAKEKSIIKLSIVPITFSWLG